MGKHRPVESLLSINIFSWDSWDEAGDDWLQFYECEFLLSELEKYNEQKPTVNMNRNGDLQIYLDDLVDSDDGAIVELNVGSLPSFRDKLNNKEEVYMGEATKVIVEFLTTDKDCTLITSEVDKRQILAFANKEGIEIVNIDGKKIENSIKLAKVHYILY